MPYLLAAVLVLVLGVVTVWLVYRVDTRARRDRDRSRTAVTPPRRPL